MNIENQQVKHESYSLFGLGYGEKTEQKVMNVAGLFDKDTLIKSMASSCFPFPGRHLEVFLQRLWNMFQSEVAWVANQLPFIVTCFKFQVSCLFSPPLPSLVKLSSSLSLLPFSACFATFLFRQLEAVIAKMTKENASVL